MQMTFFFLKIQKVMNEKVPFFFSQNLIFRTCKFIYTLYGLRHFQSSFCEKIIRYESVDFPFEALSIFKIHLTRS